ncbi:unnamed protein product, partial [Porites evermanni]
MRQKKRSATPLCLNCPKFVISSLLLALPKEAVRGKRPTDNHKKPTKVKIKVRKLLLTLCSCRRRESTFPAISYWVACQTSNELFKRNLTSMFIPKSLRSLKCRIVLESFKPIMKTSVKILRRAGFRLDKIGL